MAVLDRTIQELRETSGNTETSTGNISSGVTAASAIAALQEASGKGSRDSVRTTYRAYGELIELCIELIRQFYDLPRQFRIAGRMGADTFVSFDNSGLRPVYQGSLYGTDLGYRLPVFDIKVTAKQQSAYSRVAQNELALQLYSMGIFDPGRAEQALMCLEMMDFEGKDALQRRIGQQAAMQHRLMDYMQLSLVLAQKTDPELAERISQDVLHVLGDGAETGGKKAAPDLHEEDPEPKHVTEARARAAKGGAV